ncbi:dUTP diphosphatase [uncultured Porphyromonas sp.]|uniref:dUTP diphosphatase n=1 Tax=uncultured Porphyromonas sp. TaxID=159274 RepID=UPI00259BBBD3|nr:dUTP diphosphatase [uncultured Porphyromonas sp.]
MNNQVEIKIINQSPYPLPEYATPLSAGLDIRANIESPIELEPLQRVAVPTGLYIALPEGYEAQIRPRSGLALKHGLTLLNAPGTIDADYRGEIKAIVANLSDTKYTIEPGERICQMVVAKHAHVTWYETEALEETERGAGGFGHTGIK